LALVEFVAVYTLVTVLAVDQEKIVQALEAIPDIGAIIALLISVAREEEITVFIVVSVIGVIRILIVGIDDAQARDLVHEICELIKKWFFEIKVTAKGHGIPSVCPPTFLAIHREWLIFTINADQFLCTLIASAMV
jgi:hypothetical protein